MMKKLTVTIIGGRLAIDNTVSQIQDTMSNCPYDLEVDYSTENIEGEVESNNILEREVKMYVAVVKEGKDSPRSMAVVRMYSFYSQSEVLEAVGKFDDDDELLNLYSVDSEGDMEFFNVVFNRRLVIVPNTRRQ